MKKNPFVNFILSGISLTEFGLEIPSPFTSLELANSEISSATSWTLNCIVGGDDKRKINIAAFEALLYSAAQESNEYADSSGVPVSFAFGWLNPDGSVAEYVSYQGFTIKFSVSTSGLYMNYKVTGYASLAVQSHMPVLRIPAVCGIVQPSAVVEGLAKATKATSYYDLDIDHNDAPTLIQHGPLTTSFNKYIRGEFTDKDDYDTFPGLLSLSKSYNASREAAGLINPYKKLSSVINNRTITPLGEFLKPSNTDTTPQSSTFAYWIDEPTMTKPGVIHYKSTANLLTSLNTDVLRYGTADTNIISIQGSYDGVAYNMTDMNFTQLGFTVDSSGNSIVQDAQVVNSWSSSLANVFQAASIINDVNALASQFAGDFTIMIPGSTKQYEVAQPVSLIVYSGNTLSPISGVYNIISVGHTISNQFVTTLKLQRLVISSANDVAMSSGIYVNGGSYYNSSSMPKTKNIKSPYKVDFGELYPNFEHMADMRMM